MGLGVSLKLAWRAIRQNLLTSWITVFTVALAGGLFLGAWKTNQSVRLEAYLSHLRSLR